jgi:hypothetical protein
MADRFRSQIRASPQLAQDPNYLKLLQNASKQYKFDLPMGENGQLDVNAFAPRPTAASELDSPDKLDAWFKLSPDQRTALAKARGWDTNGADSDLFTAKQTIAPSEVTSAMTGVRTALQDLVGSKATVQQVDKILQLWGPMLPGVNLDAVVEADAATMGKLAAGVQDQLNFLVANKQLTEAKKKALLENAKSLDDWRKIDAQYKKDLGADKQLEIQEKIRHDQADEQTSRERADTAASALTIRQGELDETQLRDWWNHSDKQLTKYDPVKAAKDAVGEVKGYVDTLQAQKKDYEAQLGQLAAQHAPDDDATVVAVKQQISDLQGKIVKYDKAYNDALWEVKHQQRAENSALQRAGVTGLPRVPDQSKPDPQFQTMLDVAKKLPPAQRTQALSQSAWFRSLPAPEKKKFLGAMNNLR